MTSYIIYAENKESQQQKLQELSLTYAIDIFDQTIIHAEKETSIGIEVIKKLQEKAMLRPLRGKDKAIIIPQSELLTIPAQNALLKLLEEPPNHTYFFLLTNSMDTFLPTILSRCKIIKIKNSETISDEETIKLAENLKTWQSQSIGDALKTAEKLAKDKESTLELFKKIMTIGSKTLKTNTTPQEITLLSSQLKKLQKTYKILNTTNTNPRLTLENLFLSLL